MGSLDRKEKTLQIALVQCIQFTVFRDSLLGKLKCVIMMTLYKGLGWDELRA